jgi:uncharacterized protein (DUF983 family)
MARPINAAWSTLMGYFARCPKCGKGIFREDEDNLFAIREMGECLDCSTQPTTDTNP